MQSRNFNLSKNLFFNLSFKKNPNNSFFLLPTFIIIPNKISSWDLISYSFIFSFLFFNIYFNFYKVTMNTSVDFLKENMISLIETLKLENLSVSNIQEALDFLKANPYLILFFKNSNKSHSYIRAVIVQYFQHLPFIKPINRIKQ